MDVVKMNLPKKPTAWGCRVCKKIDFYDDAPPSASPEHVPHRGFDIGTCKGKMIPLYSEEDLLAAQQPRVPDAGDSGAYKKAARTAGTKE